MRKNIFRMLVALLSLYIVPTLFSVYAVPAFPGAEGFGANTSGGRGGKVYLITNLNDSGSGSFRDCINAVGISSSNEADFKRICIFTTGGTIVLLNNLNINKPYITIAGQTAPGDGIMLRDRPLVVTTHDVIIRGLRIRSGQPWTSSISNDRFIDLQITNYNATAPSPYNVIVDHNSFSWASGKNIALWYTPHDITLSWNIIGEALMASSDPNDGRGLLIGGNDTDDALFYNISVHHNVLVDNPDRSPIIKMDKAHPTQTGAEVINNLVYNWYWYGTATWARANIIANQYISGPNTSSGRRGIAVENRGYSPLVYLKDNIGPGRTTNTGDDWNAAVIEGDTMANVRSSVPVFSLSNVTVDPVSMIYSTLLSKAGAISPKRDAVDTDAINRIVNNTGRTLTSVTWPVMNTGIAPVDSDKDGMPDSWETAHGLNPNSAADANTVNYNGYTNIEDYINSFIPTSTSSTPSPTINTATPIPVTSVPPTLTPTSTPAPKPGDANGDGKVDETDYSTWLSHFGQTVSGGASAGDFDGNGKVDGIDYTFWMANYEM